MKRDGTHSSRWFEVRSIKKLDSLPSVDPESLLTVKERLILAEFIDIMTAFEEATDRIQGDKQVTSSFVIHAIICLKTHLKSKSWK